MPHAEHPTSILLEHRMERLPSVEDAPILERLGELGLERFQEEVAFDTPLYKNGTVNHRALVNLAKRLVAPGYRWEAPFFDEHHLYWPHTDYELPTVLYEGGDSRHLYQREDPEKGLYFEAIQQKLTLGGLPEWEILPKDEYLYDRIFQELFDLSEFEEYSHKEREYFEVASEFRELAVNKLWVPRQFHNFLHTVTRPSDTPELAVMRRAVRNSRRRDYLFQVATNAWTITEKFERSVELDLPKGAGKILVDKKDKRVYRNRDEMEERREQFVRELIAYHAEGLIDLTRLAPIEVVDSRTVERSLGAITMRMTNTELVKTRHNSRAWRVELPTRDRGRSVWLRQPEELSDAA